MIIIYTDGSCLGNPGPGGWAWALGTDKYESGFDSFTTNQRMEVTAVLQAFRALEAADICSGKIDCTNTPLQIVSDSVYVVKCFNENWWQGWLRRNWRNSKGQPVANRDIWESLIKAVTDWGFNRVNFKWVKGHADNGMNDFVDQLAREAATLRQGQYCGINEIGCP
ncbi:MAG: ribonuclease HI [Actinobacteria bacterium]|nr:ribonuclease HI [Actinomycetota bacterium]MCL6105247.1 ribonuclease HI [Actinomycetota bacterium]